MTLSKRMELIMNKEVFLDDKDIFEFVNKKTSWRYEDYSKFNTYNLSDIPVYTATLEPVAYVDIFNDRTLIQASLEQPLISFGANGDGSAGTNFVLHTRPFYVSNDRTCVKILNRKISPEYVIYKLASMKAVYGFNFSFKATPKNLRDVSFSIPLVSSGDFDIQRQQDVVKKVNSFQKTQNGLIEESKRLQNTIITMDLSAYDIKLVEISNSEYFSTSIGKRLLKKNMQSFGIPVYSANVEKPFGYTNTSNIVDFSQPALLWGIDWIYNWNYLQAGVNFATTDHCGLLRVLHPKLDPKYVYYALKTTQTQYGFDRTYRASLQNIRDVVTIQVPILSDGSFDFISQTKLANKYEKILTLQNRILEQIQLIENKYLVVDDDMNQ